ncbi:hypothetical protein [Enterococcus rivorum]|uniref:hypothetical protein n=1 Tax=Enterococcus rivorum TaxID=762845 RepID=UPI00363D5BB1
MSSVSGVWYTIGTDDDGTFWALQMVDTDFDKHLAVSAPWIKDEEELENFTPVIIKENYLNDFEQLLAEMLEVSPMNTIMILPRYQGGDTEIIQGTISLKEYIQLIKEEKIPFNVCTIVKKVG